MMLAAAIQLSSSTETGTSPFTGRVKFSDLFGRDIYTIRLTITDPIKPGQKANWAGSVKFNQFNEGHRALRNTELKDMRFAWIPVSIIFQDGTQLGGESPTK